jgi:hypothetical protein
MITINKILEILARDDYKCVYCGYDAGASLDAWRHGSMCIDHFIPRSRGGTDDDSNLFAACGACNSGKGHQRVRRPESGAPLHCVLQTRIQPPMVRDERGWQKANPRSRSLVRERRRSEGSLPGGGDRAARAVGLAPLPPRP